MHIIHVERNGRKYAYAASSKRVPGVPHPVSDMVYLGAVDPDTGEIIPKKPRKRDGGVPISDGVFDSRSLGDVLVSWGAAENLGLLEDLTSVFGDDSRMVLAMSMAEAIRPTAPEGIAQTFDTTCIPEILGIDRRGVRGRIRSTLDSIDMRGILDFLELRHRRSTGRLLVLGRNLSMFHADPTIEGRLRPGGAWSKGDTNITITADSHGVLVSYLFRVDSQRLDDLSGLIRATDDREYMVVSSSYLSSPVCVMEIMFRRCGFVVSCDPDSEIFWRLVRDFAGRRCGPVRTVDVSGTRYKVADRKIGVRPTENGWEYVLDSDPEFERCTTRFNAFVCRNGAAANPELGAIRMSIDLAKEMLTGDDSDMDIADISAVSMGVEFIEFRREEDGCVRIEVNRELLSRQTKRAGMFVVLTSLDSCEEALEAFRTRYGAMIDVSAFLDEIDGFKVAGTDIRLTNSHLFIRFLGAVIRSGIRTSIAGTGMDVEGVLHTASSLTAVSLCGRTYTSRVGPKAFRILSMFGMDGFDLTEHMRGMESDDDPPGGVSGSRWHERYP